MIAVLFELQPRSPEDLARYLALATALRAELDGVDGFVAVERFQSLADPGRYLSLSWWRDEAALRAWRQHAGHRGAQRAGRGTDRGAGDGLFAHYRLHVARVLRSYGPDDRAGAPEDARAALG